jgi:hypothetical protein
MRQFINTLPKTTTAPTQTTSAAVTTTTTTTSPVTPHRAPGHDIVRNTHRDQYQPLNVLDERTLMDEEGKEKTQLLIKWKGAPAENNTTWEDADDSAVINSGINLKWAKQQRKQKRQQQQTNDKDSNSNITTTNRFEALADGETEVKYDKETQGQPDTRDHVHLHQHLHHHRPLYLQPHRRIRPPLLVTYLSESEEHQQLKLMHGTRQSNRRKNRLSPT